MKILVYISLLLFVGCGRNQTPIPDNNIGMESSIMYLQSEQVQLAPPRITVDSLLFIESANVVLNFDAEGANIYYRLHGKNFAKYDGPITIENSTTIEVKSQKKDFKDSAIQSISLMKVGAISPSKILIRPEAHVNYPGGGPASLFDLKKGNLNFRDGQYWSGFQSDTTEIIVEFPQEQNVEAITLSLLRDHGSWIFLPKRIELWGDEKKIGQTELDNPDEDESTKLVFATVQSSLGNYKKISARVIHLDAIPIWHAGKGTKPWLFMDEVIIE